MKEALAVEHSSTLVIGAGIAGLLAARALSEHFAQVTIIERDRLPAVPEFRAGVPQARHIHILLKRGQLIVEQLFPGLLAELEAAGVPHLDWINDIKTMTFAGRSLRFPSPLEVLTCSRDLLEWHIRQRVASLPNVSLLEEHEVTGFLPTGDQTGVAGVRVRVRQGEAHELGAEENLTAGLVVDATGRSSRASEWLEALGYPRPEEAVVNSFIGYASRLYQRPPDFQANWQALVILNTPPTVLRGGVIWPVEGDRWQVTLGGVARDYPPTDEGGFLDFARSLVTPQFYEAIKEAQPLSPISGYQRMENRWRRYDRLRRWPERLLLVGDAVCQFNPYYGQGMTVAAEEALLLEQFLRKSRRQSANDPLNGVASRFQRALTRVTSAPWRMATGEDFRSPVLEGGRPDRMTRLMQWYGDGVKRLIARKPDAMITYMEVAHLLKPPTVLFRPGILGWVLWGLITRRIGGKR